MYFHFTEMKTKRVKLICASSSFKCTMAEAVDQNLLLTKHRLCHKDEGVSKKSFFDLTVAGSIYLYFLHCL